MLLLKEVQDNGLSYKDFTILRAIAQAESQWRQFDGDKVLRGRINNLDVGLFQINLKYHLDYATALGMDLTSPEGNIRYAVWLYRQNGVRPWTWSQARWWKAVL